MATVAAVLVGVDELGGQRGVTVFGTWLAPVPLVVPGDIFDDLP